MEKVKDVFNKCKNAILYVWQLPQNILGLILALFYKHERKHVMEKW